MNQVEIKRRQIEMCASIIGLINILILRDNLGNNGIAYLVIAYTGFSLVRVLISGGIAETLGKILRIRNAKGQYRNARCIKKRVLLMQCGIGVIAALVFGISAAWIAQGLFQVQYSTFLVVLLAPALAIRTASTVLIGYFQGEGTELPAAVTALFRQVILLVLSLLFVNLLGNYGLKVSALLGNDDYTAMYGGIGVAIAVNLTELLILFFLGFLYLVSKRSMEQKHSEGMKQMDSLSDIVRILYGAMWMPMLLQLLEMIPVWSSTLFYRRSVTEVTVFAQQLGLVAGMGLAFCGIWVILICALLLPINGRIAGMVKKNDIRGARGMYQSGLHIALIHGLFAVVFIVTMANSLADILCQNSALEAAEVLQSGAVLVLLAVLYFYFSRNLLFFGKKYYLLGVLVISNLIHILLTVLLLYAGKMGIMGVIYSAMAAMAAGCVLLALLCFRLLRFSVDMVQTVIIPTGAAAVVGLIELLLVKVVCAYLGNMMTVFLGLFIGAVIYWIALLILKNVREQELHYIFGGKIIHSLGQLLRIF